jgi:succinate dehydrogenase hydrophobic anchor subunit
MTMELADYQTYVHQRLWLRLLIYFFLLSVITGVAGLEIWRSKVGVIWPIVGLTLGVLGGVLFSRIYKIYWDKRAGQVIAKLDAYGAGVLVLYILFELNRDKIVGYFVHGPAVAATSLAVLAGLIFGRVLGMRRKIGDLIEQNA